MEKSDVVKQCDWLIVISLIMFLSMRIAVLILFNMVSVETGADIEAVHTAYEANPIFKSLLQLQMINYIFQFLILPAMGLAIYYFFRRKVLHEDYPVDPLHFHCLFLFFLVFMNFINDVASLIGRLI